MLGAIAGDIIGSRYEFNSIKNTKFQLFASESVPTDDSVLTVATASALIDDSTEYALYYKTYYNKYPTAGYGGVFNTWGGSSKMGAYNSFGNGSAMRVSPVGWAFDDLEDVKRVATATAKVTHSHPLGIYGARATAEAVFLARTGKSKEEIKNYISSNFNYDLNRTIEEIRPSYSFNVTCPGSVPESIIAFLDSKDFEDSIRLAVSLGGDADTQACIAGAIAEAYYGEVPKKLVAKVMEKLKPKRWQPFIAVIKDFQNKYQNYPRYKL